MIKVGLVGAPGSGKSVLASLLYQQLKDNAVNVALVTEYARDFINHLGGPPELLSQLLISDKQQYREQIVPPSVDVMITDSPCFLSYIYTLVYCDLSNKEHVELLLHMYEQCISGFFNSYDLLYFLEACPQDVDTNLFKDGTRYQDEADRIKLNNAIKSILDLHNVSYTLLQHNLETECRSRAIVSDISKQIERISAL